MSSISTLLRKIQFFFNIIVTILTGFGYLDINHGNIKAVDLVKPQSLDQQVTSATESLNGSTSSIGEDYNVSSAAKKSIHSRSCFGLESLWSLHKTRKAEGQLTNAISHSPNLREYVVVQCYVNESLVDITDPVEQNLTGVSKADDRLSISPQFPTNDAGCVSLHGVQKPLITADNADLADAFNIEVLTPNKGFDGVDSEDLSGGPCTEVHASAIGFDTGSRFSISPQLPINGIGGISNGIQDPYSGAATVAEYHSDARMSEISPEAAPSLGSIQNSKFEYILALESNKSYLLMPRKQYTEKSKNELVSGSLFPDPRPVTSQSGSDHVPYGKPAVISDSEELPDGIYMKVHDWSKGFVAEDELSVLPQFPVIDTGWSSNVVLDLDDAATSLEDQRNASINPGSVIAMPQSDDVDESELAKPVDIYDESCVVEKGSNFYSGRSTSSQSSGQQPSSMRDTSHVGTPYYIGRSSWDDNNVGCSESTEHQTEENSICLKQSCGPEVVGSWPQIKLRKVGGKIRDTPSSPNIMEDAVVQFNVSTSPVNKVEPADQHLTGGCESSTVRVSSLLPEHVHELEMVKPVDICYEGGAVDEAEVVYFQTKDGSNVFSGRITRSRSSSQQASSARESLNVSNSCRCSSKDKNVGTSKSRQQISKKTILSAKCLQTGGEGSWPQHKKRKIVGQLTDTIYASPTLRVDVVQSNVNKSSVNTMDHVELNLTGGSKSAPVGIYSLQPEYVHELDLVKPDGIHYESCVVEESKVGDFQSMEKGCNLYCGRTTGSRSSDRQASYVREFLNVSKLNYKTPLSVSPSLKAELDQSKGSQMIEESQSSSGFQFDESLEKREKCSYTPLTFMHEEGEVPLISSLVEAEVADPTSIICDSTKQCIVGEGDVLLHLDDKFGLGDTEHLTSNERGTQERNSHLGEIGNFSSGLVGSPHRHSMDLTGADQTMPDLEGFIIKADNKQSCLSGERMSFDELDLPKSSIEPTSVLEQLHKSAFMHTPSPHFSTTHKLHRAPDMYPSVPNGLLECMDSRSDLSIDDYTGKQIKPSYSFFSDEVNHDLQGRSYSDCLPFSSTQSAWDIKKLRDRTTTASGNSEKRGSLNPELPYICEENEDTYEVADVFQEDICSEMVPSSVKREPLAKITDYLNLPQSVSKAEIFFARNSIESVNTEYSLSGTSNRVKQKLGHHNSRKKEHTTKAKMSHGTSLGESSINRVTGSDHNRFSKPKLSGKASLRKGGLSFLERESKRNSIVSIVTSFVPLVQQKQEAAIITGKRGVRVKLLEAVEAAKHLAQVKEDVCKMKKDALKLESARLKHENLKQLELKRKKKEGERKKKEADMSVRKRQQEEEEKKKGRKQKRVMNAGKQLREDEEKLHSKKEKEVKCQALGEQRVVKVKALEVAKEAKRVAEEKENTRKMMKEVFKSEIARRKEEKVRRSELEKIEKEDDQKNKKAQKRRKEAMKQKQSYDISPYASGDERGGKKKLRTRPKFIPAWARGVDVAMMVAQEERLDVEVIFDSRRNCTIDEALMPRERTKPRES